MSSIFFIFSEYLHLLTRHFNVHRPILKDIYNCVYYNLDSASLVVLLLAYHVDQITVRQSGCPFWQNFRCRFCLGMLELLAEELGVIQLKLFILWMMPGEIVACPGS